MVTVDNVKFEHYHAAYTLGVHERRPRLSWNLQSDDSSSSGGLYNQQGYEVECTWLSNPRGPGMTTKTDVHTESVRCESRQSVLVPWPFNRALCSRQRVKVRVRLYDDQEKFTPWSEPSCLETGLLERSDWECQRIAAPWGIEVSSCPSPEQLYRKQFNVDATFDDGIAHARLYITSQGVYETEINGQRIGDHFLAPGWTAYDGRLQYQTYDVTAALATGPNCLGVRVAEGWFSGRLGFEGGHRNIWGPQSALLAQLEITSVDGRVTTIVSDESWHVIEGPIRLAEIYDGEHYDGTREVPNWSLPTTASGGLLSDWSRSILLPPLDPSVKLVAGYSEPARRVAVLRPLQRIVTPAKKHVVDFGQNLVGYVRLRNIRGPRGHKITLRHAEVLEHQELCTRTLRLCKAIDTYTLNGAPEGETYEPRFTFHGFRYAQIDDWPTDGGEFKLEDVEAVVCHTDMRPAGSFDCSEPLLNQLHSNIEWSMRGNFLSVPTDCPQRDERLGWTGDLALFAPTATLLYDCYGILRNWLIDVEHDQGVLNGVPPMVSPNVTIKDPVWLRKVPCAVWHDATILAPWALYQETGDKAILQQQWNSMAEWMQVLPRGVAEGKTHLWSDKPFQLGDWLDPNAPPDAPWRSPTDARMVANMFLVHSLDLMSRISAILNDTTSSSHYSREHRLARAEFHDEYITRSGRLVSDTQAAYALAICLEILDPHSPQMHNAGNRLAHLARRNGFRLATGFAGTPFVCEALARTGHEAEAYALLLETGCPSWLYPVTMGATTVWERWDSMLPDGTVNPGEMTSFNHYAFGAIAKFLYERVAGLQRLEPGWTRFRVAPMVGATLTSSKASHETRYGSIEVAWTLGEGSADSGYCSSGTNDGRVSQEEDEAIKHEGTRTLRLTVTVPYGTSAEVVLPGSGSIFKDHDEGEPDEETIDRTCPRIQSRNHVVGPGTWSFSTKFKRDYKWPLPPLPVKNN